MTIGERVQMFEPIVVIRGEMIEIQHDARIDSFVKLEGGLRLVIGPWVHVASFCHIGIGGGVTILEEGSAVASGAKIISGSNQLVGRSMSAAAPRDQQSVTRKTTRVGKNAFICTNATVLPGVTIGEHAVLAAGSVAAKDIPAWELWGGVPARKIRNLITS